MWFDVSLIKGRDFLETLVFLWERIGLVLAIVGLGNKAAGMIGGAAEDGGEMTVFGVIAAACLLIGILLFFLVKKLKAISHGAEDLNETPPAFVDPE